MSVLYSSPYPAASHWHLQKQASGPGQTIFFLVRFSFVEVGALSKEMASKSLSTEQKGEILPKQKYVQIGFSFRAHNLTTSQLIRKNSVKPFTGVKHAEETVVRQLHQKPCIPRISWLIWSFLHPKCCHWSLCCSTGFCQVLQTLSEATKGLQIKQFKNSKVKFWCNVPRGIFPI